MWNFSNDIQTNIQTLDAVIGISLAILSVITWLLRLSRSKEISNIKRYIFLCILSCWGIGSGILLLSNIWLGSFFVLLLLATVLWFGYNQLFLLNSIINSNSTIIVSKNAIYNVFCETVQRICLALVSDAAFSGNDIRVSIFAVDWKSHELALAGRYPIFSENIPTIKYKIGRGTSGVAAENNYIIRVEDLPEWNLNANRYIKILSNYNITEDEIEHFHTKARCYYAFPIVERDADEGVNVVKFIVSVDSVHPKISSNTVTSENLISVIEAYIHNNRQMLFKTFIGNTF
jgi:hypothetical protein